MYSLQNGFPITVQQIATGTGQFNGTSRGRARCVVSTTMDPDADVVIVARVHGALANSISIVFQDTGPGTTVTQTTVSQTGTIITVKLRRNAGAVLADSGEVAMVINSYPYFTLPISAERAGSVSAVVAATVSPVGLGSTVAGFDPTTVPPRAIFSWEYGTNTNGGYFYFENHDFPVVLRYFGAKFTIPGGTATVTFTRVNVTPIGTPITATAIPIYVYDGLSTAKPDFAISDPRTVIQPGQVVLVTTSTPLAGTVQIDAQKLTAFPSL